MQPSHPAQTLLQLVLVWHSAGAAESQMVEDQSRVEQLRLSDTDLIGVRAARQARRANFVSRSEEVQDQGSTFKPWVAFRHRDSPRQPRINRGAGQTNGTQPQSGDKNSKQINSSQAEEVVTIKIAGEPVIIPDFEISAKPPRENAEIIQIPVQIQATEIIAQPKGDKELEKTAQPKSSDLKLFSPSSDIFQKFQTSSVEARERTPKSQQTWWSKSSGPNHVFEIFVPLGGERNENSNEIQVNNLPKLEVSDLATKTSFELKTLSNDREKLINKNKKRVNSVQKQKPQDNLPKTKFELQTVFKFVADQKNNLNKPKKIFKARKPKVTPKPSVKSEEKEVEPCPNSLEECVDGCIQHEDIYAYSGCVVQCGESCG